MHIYIYGICIEGDGTTRNYQNDHRCNPKTRIMSVASMQVVASELGIIKIEWQMENGAGYGANQSSWLIYIYTG